MIDSQENVLEQEAQLEGKSVEENVVNEAKETADKATEGAQSDSSTAEEEDIRRNYTSKKEVVDRLREIAHGENAPEKEEVDYLKTIFYKLHFAEREAAQKAYLDAGGDPEKYSVLPDEDEEVFKAEMGIIKERRAKLFQEQEAEKQENLKKKLDIIERIKNMATSPEEANKTYQEFKKLQQEWKDIKSVPAEKANELWRNYQLGRRGRCYQCVPSIAETSPRIPRDGTCCKGFT